MAGEGKFVTEIYDSELTWPFKTIQKKTNFKSSRSINVGIQETGYWARVFKERNRLFDDREDVHEEQNLDRNTTTRNRSK